MASSQTLELLLYPPYFPVDQKGNPLFSGVIPYREVNLWRHVHCIDMTSCHNPQRKLLISC